MNLFFRFLTTGTLGALISLSVTWVLTTFFLGVDSYFTAYVVGILANLLFNFIGYTIAVFKTQRDHVRRLAVFLFYAVIMAFFQGSLVRFITPVFGAEFYLAVIACVIASLAILNFFVYKLSIFKERSEGESSNPRAILVFIILCAVIVRLATLLHVISQEGVAPLIYGDAHGYVELAQNLASGNGFVSSDSEGVPEPEVFRTPGLPLLLAPFAHSEVGLGIYFALLAIIAGVLLPSLTYAIANRVVPTTAALIAAALAAFEPHLIFFSTFAQTEVPFILFAYGGLYAGMVGFERRSHVYAMLAGTLLAFATLIKPGFLPVFAAALLGAAAYAAIINRTLLKTLALIFVCGAIVLTPWFIRMHDVTGVVAMSGAGWRNVYTDYLASVRAIENGTEFSVEKRALKDSAEEAGVPTEEVDNPAYASKLRDYALAELWEKKDTVLKLETVLLMSYFLQDGYYYQMRRLFIIPADTDKPHISPTYVFMNKGIAGIGEIAEELSRQYFIPVVGRVWTFGIAICALIGVFITRSRLRYLFIGLILLSALTATVIGLGVESRLRLPMLPLLFILASACLSALPVLRFPYEDRRLHPRL